MVVWFQRSQAFCPDPLCDPSPANWKQPVSISHPPHNNRCISAKLVLLIGAMFLEYSKDNPPTLIS